MSYYTELDGQNTVVRVLRCSDDDTQAQAFLAAQGGNWQRAYPSGAPGTTKNFPGIGWTYDAQRDAFIPPKPDAIPGYGEFTLNETTCLWDAPAGWNPKP